MRWACKVALVVALAGCRDDDPRDDRRLVPVAVKPELRPFPTFAAAAAASIALLEPLTAALDPERPCRQIGTTLGSYHSRLSDLSIQLADSPRAPEHDRAVADSIAARAGCVAEAIERCRGDDNVNRFAESPGWNDLVRWTGRALCPAR